MKSLLCILALLAAAPVQGFAADVDVSQLSYDEVKKHFEKDEKLDDVKISGFTASTVTVIYKGRYLNYDLNKLTPAQRTQIDQLIAHERDARQEQAARENEAAARAGMLREVDGAVYNLLKPPADWMTFRNVKVFQKTDDGLLVNTASGRYDLSLIFVRNLPQFENVADGDTVSFMAKQTGTHTYITRGGADKTVRQYDCGTLPGKGKKPALVRAPGEKQSAIDPQWDSSGTGFFITEDGYLATCNHVVDDGKVFSGVHSRGQFPGACRGVG